MTLDEIKKDASEKYNKMLDLSIKITDDFNSARRLDIEQLRNLLVQVSIVSFGAVGFAIPLIGSSPALKNPTLFIFGIFLLLITALGGLWYSAIIIENSIKKSSEGYRQNKNEIHEAIENQVFLMKNPDKYDEFVNKVKKFAESLKDKNTNSMKIKRDKVLYVLLLFLSIGIFSIFLSLLPLKEGGSQINKSLNFKKPNIKMNELIFTDPIGTLNINKNEKLKSNINTFMESKVSDNALGKDNYHCSNILYGYDDKHAYAWVYCSGFKITETEELEQGTAFSTPTRLEYTKPNFDIIDYKQPGDGNQYDTTLRKLFPKKFYDMDHPSHVEISLLEDELKNKATAKINKKVSEKQIR